MTLMNKISLEEAKKIKLMNRIDKKYVIDFEQFCLLIPYILDNYYIVSDSNQRILLPYKSIYFDTKNYDMYNDHKVNKENRQKIRIREYSSGDKFLEIKNKNNSKTNKIRIQTSSYLLNEYKKWIVDNLNYDINNLKEKLEVIFKRLTIVSKDKKERITIDFGISFYNFTNNKFKRVDEIIIEVKKPDENKSDFENKLNSLNIQETKISKYFLGITLTK